MQVFYTNIRLMLAVFMFTQTAFWCSGVKRIKATEVHDLSGRWNSTDLQVTGDSLVKQLLAGRWLEDFVDKHGRKPRIATLKIKNKTREHIETEPIREEVEQALVTSHRVTVVENKAGRERNRDENDDIVNREEINSALKKMRVDYQVEGRVDYLGDAHGSKGVRYYRISLTVKNAMSGEKICFAKHEIKKLVQK